MGGLRQGMTSQHGRWSWKGLPKLQALASDLSVFSVKWDDNRTHFTGLYEKKRR